MTTEEKSPTSTVTIEAGWWWPERAFASDNQYTFASKNLARQEYRDYGFSVPTGSAIDEAVLKVEGLISNPPSYLVAAYWWDGSIWHGAVLPFTTSETIQEKDITAWIDTPDKVNNLKTQIAYLEAGAGGCFPPASEFLYFDGKDFDMVSVEKLEEGDPLLGVTEQREFFPAKVTRKTVHKGTYEIVRAFLLYPRCYANETCEHRVLKRLFDLTPEKEVLSDVAWTVNHPVYTMNRGIIPAANLQVGDALGELYYDRKLRQITYGAVPVELIERYEHRGKVYDLKGEGSCIFGRHLLGHLAKEPW